MLGCKVQMLLSGCGNGTIEPRKQMQREIGRLIDSASIATRGMVEASTCSRVLGTALGVRYPADTHKVLRGQRHASANDPDLHSSLDREQLLLSSVCDQSVVCKHRKEGELEQIARLEGMLEDGQMKECLRVSRRVP